MLEPRRFVLPNEDRYVCRAYQELDLGYHTYQNKTIYDTDQYQSERYPGKDYHSRHRLKQQDPLLSRVPLKGKRKCSVS